MKTIKRILLNTREADNMASLVEGLREENCKTDTSKAVNVILEIFFSKYVSLEFEAIKGKFFDKKSYLKKLISDSSVDDIDESIKNYLKKRSPKNLKRKNKPTP